ncbi:phage tail protein [Escherichia coli]|nr:hypothetical protein [Escherichia coli]OUF88171.1 phage tail protein [Escherichia coli]
MHRIDTKTAQKDKFGAGKNGFTRGNPQTGTPATDLDDDYFDMLQEELCSVVEASGASLEKGRHDQLLTALRALLLSRKNPFGDIKSDGTVKRALENLGLGEGSALPVGVGVPWLSAIGRFGFFVCGGGSFSFASCFVLAWGSLGAPLLALGVVFLFGFAFGRGFVRVLVLLAFPAGGVVVGYLSCGVFSSGPVDFILGGFTGGLVFSFFAFVCSFIYLDCYLISISSVTAGCFFAVAIKAACAHAACWRDVAFDFVVRVSFWFSGFSPVG